MLKYEGVLIFDNTKFGMRLARVVMLNIIQEHVHLIIFDDIDFKIKVKIIQKELRLAFYQMLIFFLFIIFMQFGHFDVV